MDNNYNFELFEAKRDNFSQDSTQEVVKKHKNNNNKTRIALIAVITVIVLTVVCAAVLAAPLLSSNHNPDKFADKFVKNLIQNDWDNIYDDSQFYNSPVITKEHFINYCEQNKQVTVLNGVKISDYIVEKDKESENSINYSIHYVTDTSEYGVYYLTVNKVEDKFWRYDTYKAELEGDSVCSIKIYAPSGTQVSINSANLTNAKEITERSATDSSNVYLNEYDIVLLDDTYNIEAQNESCNNYTQSAEINKETDDYYIEMTLSENAYNSLCSKGAEIVKTMYTQACSGSLTQQSIDVSESFSGDDFNAVISDIQNSIYASDSSIEVTDFQITGTSLKSSYSDNTKIGYESDGKTEIIFTFDYKYTISNTAAATSEQREDHGYANIEFIYQNSQWVVNDIACRAYF